MTARPPEYRRVIDAHRLARLLRWPLTLLLAGVLLVVLPPWLALLYQRFMPRTLERQLALGILHAARWTYIAAAVCAPMAFAFGLAWTKRAHARRRHWRPAARWALLGASVLLAIGPAEWIAAQSLARSRRLPRLPTRFAAAPGSPQTRTIVVIGESSARGEPYHTWLSAAQIAAWGLERAIPASHFRVDMRASGGLCLEQAITRLVDLEYHPDAVLICSGHNEFQARFGWSRNVAYYADEAPGSGPSALIRGLVAVSPVCRLIEQAMERNRLDRPPPPHATRELVDRPAFTAEEYAFLLDDYATRLDHLLDWCDRIGTLPIVIVPAGNDTDFPPNRSYLDPSTTAAERRRFADDFRAAGALEDRGSLAMAIAAYEALVSRQLLFAEAHYRLGRLLLRVGRPVGDHFNRARDLDGMPMRMPSDFQAAARTAALRHRAVLVETQAVLDAGRRSDRFHDAQHPTLGGYIALAGDLLEKLKGRGAFGWPDSASVPRLDPAECASHFGIDDARWATVCGRSANFYARVAFMRYDPSPHLARSEQYREAARRIESGGPFEDFDWKALGLDLLVITGRAREGPVPVQSGHR